MKQIIIFTIFISLNMACQHADKSSNEKLLTNYNWSITRSEMSDKKGKMISDDVARPCNKDDILSFSLDKKFSLLGGIEKCNPEEGSIRTSATWEISENGKNLSIKYKDGPPVVYQIQELSSKKMILRQDINEGETITTILMPKNR